jgi:hypothetical protein
MLDLSGINASHSKDALMFVININAYGDKNEVRAPETTFESLM